MVGARESMFGTRGSPPEAPEASGGPQGIPGVTDRERPLLAALGDEVALGLLVALSRGPRDVHSLVVQTGLPQSSVYRKLRELSAAGLVRTDRLAFTRDRRKVELFKTPLREIRLRLESGRLGVDVLLREDTSDRLGALWDDVQRFGR